MIDNRFFLCKKTLEEEGSVDFLLRIAKEDKSYKNIWNLSDKALAWTSIDHFRNYLQKDFGRCHLYWAYYKSEKLGFLGMLNLNMSSGCANLIAWIDKSIRGKGFLEKWIILFLLEAQKEGVERWYAKIKVKNKRSINAALKYEFTKCPIPSHLKNVNNDEDKINRVTRKTLFTTSEKRLRIFQI